MENFPSNLVDIIQEKRIEYYKYLASKINPVGEEIIKEDKYPELSIDFAGLSYSFSIDTNKYFPENSKVEKFQVVINPRAISVGNQNTLFYINNVQISPSMLQNYNHVHWEDDVINDKNKKLISTLEWCMNKYICVTEKESA